MKTTLLLAATAVGLSIPATSAFSQESAAIEYADLNLDSPEGQKRLDLRIRKAVEQVCAVNEAPTGTRIRTRESRVCEAQAYAKAQQQVAALMEDKRLGG